MRISRSVAKTMSPESTKLPTFDLTSRAQRMSLLGRRGGMVKVSVCVPEVMLLVTADTRPSHHRATSIVPLATSHRNSTVRVVW